jgi:hypothetical protein
MVLLHLVRYVVFVPARQWAVEASFFALAAAFLVSAELLATMTAGYTVPDTEILPFIYLVMMQ